MRFSRSGSIFGSMLCVGFALIGTVSCQRSAEKSADVPADKIATIRVLSGNGRLAGGEEYSIAEWRSGIQTSGTGAFADFRGQDGGPTLDLSLKGLDGIGEFVCGGSESATLELRVDVNNAYRAADDAPCEVEVERIENGVVEGRYTATLRHTGNPSDEMTVAGTFRATQPGAQDVPTIEAAKAPKILGR
jgi:hypothetical protein